MPERGFPVDEPRFLRPADAFPFGARTIEGPPAEDGEVDGIVRERLGAPPEAILTDAVVAVDEADGVEPALRFHLRERGVAGGGRAGSAGELQEPESGIGLRGGLENGEGPVARAVVDRKDDEAPVGLCGDRGKAFGQVALRVEDGENDGEAEVFGCGHRDYSKKSFRTWRRRSASRFAWRK